MLHFSYIQDWLGRNRPTFFIVILDVTYTILPRDLMTFVKNQKKVLFIDYREDSSSFIKYDRPEGVFVARVPPNAIVPG